MISTVTTSTVTTVTTVAAMGLTAAVTAAAIICLIVFLTAKELTGASGNQVSYRLARFLSIGILPLLMAFAVIVVVRIIQIV